MLDDQLPPQALQKLIRDAYATGGVRLSKHARDRMKQRNMSAVDIENTATRGWLDQENCEWDQRGWRYRVTTHRMWVVVVVRSEEPPAIAIVTCCRI